MISIVIGTAMHWGTGTATGLVGDKSPWAVVIAGVVIGVVIVCFAEVASYFDSAGGPYLYAREAFGQFAGIYVGWLGCLVRVASTAAGCNLMITYLAAFWPPADKGVFPVLLTAGILTIICSLNILGVKLGAMVINCFAVAKLVPLFLFILAGLFLVFRNHLHVQQPVVEAGVHNWAQALLVLVFAYGGFEAAVVPMSEAKNPRKDAPFALFTSLIASVFVYTLFTVVIVLSLPNAGSSKIAALDAAQVLFGHRAVVLLSLGALVAAAGYQFASVLTGARIPFALAERGDLPALFARVHPRFRTPHVSIILFGLATLILAMLGGFVWSAVLSAAARLVSYAVVCAAVFVFRTRNLPGIRIPGAPIFATLGVLFCLALAVRMDVRAWEIMLTTSVIAWITWLWARPTVRAGIEETDIHSGDPSK